MSSLEEQNQDLMMKLFVARNEIEKSNSRLQEIHQRMTAYEKIHLLFYEIKANLAEANATILEQESTINWLQKTNSEVLAENLILKNPQHLSESPVELVFPKPIERPKLVSPPQTEDVSPARVVQHHSHAPHPIEIKNPSEVQKAKALTMAEKLKLSLAQSPPPSEPVIQPKKVEKTPITRIVVKESTTTNNNAASNPVYKTNSIMVTKLWRGLKKEDIIDYFEKYGKLVAISMTESGNAMLDGYKYMFLKFADANVVEKLLANNGSHTIKKVSIVVKRGTHTF